MDATPSIFGGGQAFDPVRQPAGSDPRTVVPGELKPGHVLDDRFRIVEMTNRGGMACIYKATDLQDGTTVAVKVPLLKYESEPVTFTRFKREEEIALQLDHPFILKVREVADKTRPYLVMEFLQGQTLNKVMAATKPLPEHQALRIASQIADALEHLRAKGIVHRDLKPENVMICPDGTIRLFDFGIAKASSQRRLTFAGLVPSVGTPDYMAPEQVRGDRGDHRVDLYSLGAVLYEMTTGRLPFEADNAFVSMNARTTGDPVAPRVINDELSPQAEEVILHAMARDPADRYATAAEMKAEMDDLSLVRLTARHASLQKPRYEVGQENPWIMRGLLIAVAVVAVQFVAFGALYWYFSAHGHP